MCGVALIMRCRLMLAVRPLWECRGGIRDGAGRNAAKPCDTGDSRFFLVAENGTKAALTTGMTTDRKIFDFLPHRDIMAEIKYPGIAKLVSRLVWECVDPIHARLGQKPAKPCGTGDSGFSSGCRKRHKSGFDHRNDHRQKNLYFYRSPWYHGRKMNIRV